MEEQEKKEENKKQKSTVRKVIEWVLTGVFGLIFVVLAIGQVMGMVDSKNHYGQTIRFGYCTFVVQTDSMEPVYKVKDAIITYREKEDKFIKDFDAGKNVDLSFFDAYQGDGFTPSDPIFTNRTNNTGVVMTHRLREYQVDMSKEYGQGRYKFIVAGINDGGYMAKKEQYQVFTEKEYLGVVVNNSAVLGGVFNFMTSIWGLFIILLVPAGYVVVVSVLDIFKAYKDDDEDEVKENVEGDSSSEGTPKTRELSEADKKRLKEQLLEEMLNKKKK